MANGTGAITADLPIDTPYPRSEEFRTSQRYGEILPCPVEADQTGVGGSEPRMRASVLRAIGREQGDGGRFLRVLPVEIVRSACLPR